MIAVGRPVGSEPEGKRAMKLLEAAAAVSLALSLAVTGVAGDSHAQDGDAVAVSREAAARAAVDGALEDLKAVLANTDLTSEQRLASVEKIVRERFDMEAAARGALGKRSRRVSGPHDASYKCEFEPYLSNYIGTRFDGYQEERLEIFSAERSKSHVIVRTRVIGGEYDQVVIDFRMRESGGRWRVLDVTFDGISVVRNLRAQFKEVLSAGGLERLVQILAEKNGSRSDC